MIGMRDEKKAQAIARFSEGFTWEETAKSIGVGVATLFRWASSDPEFKLAIDEAKADPDNEVEAVTYALACNPDPAHNTLRMFWLNSRKNYKVRSDITSGNRALAYIERAKNPRDLHAISNGNGHTNGNGVPPKSPPEAMETD
jgi:hypothetical protein